MTVRSLRNEKGGLAMKRREFLASAALGTATLAAPRIASAQNARVLRFVPQANLSSLDAVAGTQYVVRNAALLIWDMPSQSFSLRLMLFQSLKI